jgi:hypothetical protein
MLFNPMGRTVFPQQRAEGENGKEKRKIFLLEM